MRRSRVLTALAALATAVACAGCGLGPGAGPATVHLRVSEDFGARPVKSVSGGAITRGESELTLLQRHFRVRTNTSGPTEVASIDGLAGAGSGEVWSYWINGVAPTKDAASTKVHRGDHVWFDLHDPQAASTIPAVVGSFPEPFQSGINGQRYPSTISYSAGDKPAASLIIGQFSRLHIPLSSAAPGYGANDVLAVNVGTWDQLYPEVVADLLRYGPGASGVYAHFGAGGTQIDLEDASGAVVRRLGAGAGLVAAIATTQDPVPTWLVIGTDHAGVLAAARAVNAADLADHLAIAVQGGRIYPLPLASGSG